MNILAIDTATEACSVALSVGDAETAVGEAETEDSIFEVCPQQHSQQILPMIDALLIRNNIKISDLDAIAYGRGPGSFTGVRIAASTAQGLAFGCNLPVLEISTLATMAQQNYAEHAVLSTMALIDARMQEVYAGCFTIVEGVAKLDDQEVVIGPIDALEIFKKQRLGAAGTGYITYADMFSQHVNTQPKVMYPNALHMLPLAKYQFTQAQMTNADNIQPVYVRDKVTWQKLPHRR